MKPLSEVAPGLLVIQIQIQAVWEHSPLGEVKNVLEINNIHAYHLKSERNNPWFNILLTVQYILDARQ
jgi:hypothetical protein